MINIKERLYIIEEEDHYKILGVKDSADLEEISKAYRKLAKIFHPDKHFQKNDQEREQLEIIFTKITRSFNLLKEPNERKKYDLQKKLGERKKQQTIIKVNQDKQTIFRQQKENQIKPVLSGNENKIETRKKKAEELFGKAINLYESAENEQAISLLRYAIELNPDEAIYHSYLGLALLKKGWNGYAMSEFQVALKLKPDDPLAKKHYVKQEVEKKEEKSFLSKLGKVLKKEIF